MAPRQYCLECNQLLGESDEESDLPQDHPVEEWQSCAQHQGVEPGEGENLGGEAAPV